MLVKPAPGPSSGTLRMFFLGQIGVGEKRLRQTDKSIFRLPAVPRAQFLSDNLEKLALRCLKPTGETPSNFSCQAQCPP